jgi:hypothetical protein
MKPVSLIVSVLLALIAVMHLLRMIFDVQIVAGDWVVPMWISVGGCLVTGALAVLLWREGRK